MASENSICLQNQQDTIRLCDIVTWMDSGSTEFLRITGAAGPGNERRSRLGPHAGGSGLFDMEI